MAVRLRGKEVAVYNRSLEERGHRSSWCLLVHGQRRTHQIIHRSSFFRPGGEGCVVPAACVHVRTGLERATRGRQRCLHCLQAALLLNQPMFFRGQNNSVRGTQIALTQILPAAGRRPNGTPCQCTPGTTAALISLISL